jgi:hypothetical protein
VKRRHLLLGGAGAALALGAALLAAQMHGFGDAERWAKEFDDPARDAWQKPDEVIRALLTRKAQNSPEKWTSY